MCSKRSNTRLETENNIAYHIIQTPEVFGMHLPHDRFTCRENHFTCKCTHTVETDVLTVLAAQGSEFRESGNNKLKVAIDLGFL
jgi:hypothetical protein